MKTLVALLAFVVVVSAQRPEPCATPPEWQGRFFQVDPSKKVAVFGKLSYDEPGERIALAEEVDLSGKETFYDFIILYREHLLYRIELSVNRTGECTVSKFDHPFQPARIPRNASFLVEAVIGSNAVPQTGVQVNVFHGEIGGGRYVATVTSFGCLPVGSVFFSEKTGAVHSSYFDIAVGVDPERFVPPEDCKEVEHHPDRVPIHHHN